MKKDFAGIELSASEFSQLSLLCQSDPKFPQTYLEWLTLVEEGRLLALGVGLVASPFRMDVANFGAWCSLVGIVPCLEALRAYAIIGRKQQMKD
ncbi:hypothetical protein [Eleftheria terrae]|uniref:hypothetical protein n=1 Tax=Eleftheria terrae TaxID=1597781 RepID=UPI00263BE031|nr:hypothetical protein [Eleftheria terrae]WKB50736.1 hypothetical protein N7L95_12980 [Eleftheria terrae]